MNFLVPTVMLKIENLMHPTVLEKHGVQENNLTEIYFEKGFFCRTLAELCDSAVGKIRVTLCNPWLNIFVSIRVFRS